MKIAVITGLAGLNSATVIDPINAHAGVDYFAFVDSNKAIQLDTAKRIDPIAFSSLRDGFADRRNTKLAKVLGFLLVPGYDYYVWHDHYLDVYVHPKIIIEKFMQDNDMAVFKHIERNCVYAELFKCAEYGNDHNQNFQALYHFLKSQNYPEQAGLFEMSSFVYRNTPKVQAMMFSWWEMICRFSSRDQISFPYVKALHNVTHGFIPGAALRYGGNNEYIPEVRSKLS
jgi:hypothetical protein